MRQLTAGLEAFSVVVTVAGILMGLAVLLLCPNPWATHEEKMTALCVRQHTRLMIAMMEYSADHDDYLPSSASWTTDIAPYLKGEGSPFTCPIRSQSGELTYAMSRAVSGRQFNDTWNPMNYVLLYEVRRGSIALPHHTYPRNLWQYPAWRRGNGQSSPSDRRPDWYMWITFADGHYASKARVSAEYIAKGYDPIPF